MGVGRDEIVRVVREVLCPLIAQDGGEVFLLDASDSHVSLHLAGRFSGSPGNTLTTRRLIEPAIRAVAPDVTVEVTSGVRVPEGATRLLPEERRA